MASQYIQTDESTVPVVDNDRTVPAKAINGASATASPSTVLLVRPWFQIEKYRPRTPRGYRGTFQSDGYEAYDQFCGIAGVRGAACWAHVRRKFVEACARTVPWPQKPSE